jgi:hypothetical protein
MVDYLRTGLGIGKSRDELLDELAKKYQRSSRQIERYIGPSKACSANQTYEETPHRRRMRELTKALTKEVKIPTFWDTDLWNDLPVEFKKGRYSLSIGETKISQDGQITVTYPDVGAGVVEPHLLKGLFSHLSSSGSRRFAELVHEPGLLHSLAIETGQYSQALLTFLKLLTDDVKERKERINFRDDAEPGLKKWFVVTAWYCLLWRAIVRGTINDSLYRPHESIQGTDLLQLRFSAYVIGVARSEQILEMYEGWHKETRLRYANHPLAKDVAHRYKTLGESVQDITRRLNEFSDMQNLPGHCHLCQPSYNCT